MHRKAAPRIALLLAIALVLVACSGSDPEATPATPTSTSQPATTTTLAPAPATVEKSLGDGTRPTIVSFTVTPTANAPCHNGKVQATMSWEVTPATATVTIKDTGSFGNPTPGDEVGPYASSATGVEVPASVSCDGTEHNLSLTATNGGPAFAGRTATIASETP